MGRMLRGARRGCTQRGLAIECACFETRDCFFMTADDKHADSDNNAVDAAKHAAFEQDQATLVAIGKIYCSAHHGADGCSKACGLCPECTSVIEYALAKTQRCPNNHEGNCKDCPIHCYNGAMRDAVRAMMSYAAPRMLLRHPVMTMRYLRKKIVARKRKR